MGQEQTKKILKMITIVLFIATLLTALVLIIFFPPMKVVGYQIFLGALKDQWLPFHKWLGIAFAVIAIISYAMHWKDKKKIKE
jgi:preprotein translocase subunit SecG